MNETVFNRLNRIAFVVLLGLIVFQTSCQKENKTSLNGTVWKGTENGDGYYEEYTVLFQESTFALSFTITMDDYNANAIVSETGTYTYNHPNITLSYTDNGESYTLSGTISGNQMILYDDETTLVFTKQ